MRPRPRPPTVTRTFPESGTAARLPDRLRHLWFGPLAKPRLPARGRSRISRHCFPAVCPFSKQRLAEHSKDHPDAQCLPINPVQLHSHPQPRKITQIPGLVLILYEANGGIRQIFTDGRPLPDKDADPWWYGYSAGKWEGDTLLVQTTGFRELGWIDEEGTPLTSAGRLTERFRRLNYGTLEIEITVDDPKTFTRPWKFTLDQRLLPDTELIEFVCLENNTSLQHLVAK